MTKLLRASNIFANFASNAITLIRDGRYKSYKSCPR